jgi:hypothetical protein
LFAAFMGSAVKVARGGKKPQAKKAGKPTAKPKAKAKADSTNKAAKKK